MREIKYRAWDKTINYMDDRVRISHFKGVIEVLDSFSKWRELKKGEYELMQYTGLKDKNGVEIYDGDILKNSSGAIGYVVYLIQEAGFVVILKRSDYRLGHRNTNESYNQMDRHEIIGNIYENPELLAGD